MRKVVPSKQVYHLWAHEQQSEARNSTGSVKFDGPDAYSYGTIIGRIVRNDAGAVAYLVSDRSYSVTTSGHQSQLRRAIPGFATVFHVAEVAPGGRNRSGEPTHAGRLVEYSERIQQAEAKAKRARLKWNKEDWATRAADLMTEANEYCRFFGLADMFDRALVARLLDEQAATRARLDREAAERREMEANERRARMADDVERWIHGDITVDIYRHPDVFLRPATDASGAAIIETSLGAEVPIHHARRLFRAWIDGTALVGDRVGAYHLDRIDNGHALVIGCHRITRAEAQRLADSLGW